MVTERYKPWTHTPFENWVVEEGLKVIQGQEIPDVYAVELTPWARTGCQTALIDLTGTRSKAWWSTTPPWSITCTISLLAVRTR